MPCRRVCIWNKFDFDFSQTLSLLEECTYWCFFSPWTCLIWLYNDGLLSTFFLQIGQLRGFALPAFILWYILKCCLRVFSCLNLKRNVHSTWQQKFPILIRTNFRKCRSELSAVLNAPTLYGFADRFYVYMHDRIHHKRDQLISHERIWCGRPQRPSLDNWNRTTKNYWVNCVIGME